MGIQRTKTPLIAGFILHDFEKFKTYSRKCRKNIEFGDLVTQIWGKQNKKTQQQLPDLPDIVAEVAEFWQLSAYLNPIREIQRINESLKEYKPS